MRTIIPLNRNWSFSYIDKNGETIQSENITLPHTNLELPCNCFDETDYQFESYYSRILKIPETAGANRVFLDFEGVMAAAEVFIDDKPAGDHKGGYTPFTVEITNFVRPGAEHSLTVRTDARENPEIPPFGNVIDFLTFGGIYREVQLRLVSPVFISDVFAKPVISSETGNSLDVEISFSDQPETGSSVSASVETEKGEILCRSETAAETPRLNVSFSSLDVEPWDIDSPVLYTVRIRMYSKDRKTDEVTVRTGFRSCRFTARGFFLNGKKLQIRGLNRHQSFPYVGYAMPERVQRRDADILKYELGLNMVRTSHYPQSKHFLDRCDEIGLLVFEEISGWQHIGGERWKLNSVNEAREMVIRDRNRPSVVIWGVRINESQDDDDFYAETNRVARKLDPTRQTGGVRYIEHSGLLEDVYTMNDFIHSGNTSKYAILRNPAKVARNRITGRRAVPYIVTEFNGHMFPTKRFDNEERLREHALRHLRVLDRAGSDPRICGTVGWCAFDYNTHREFGSGDRICYHGVSDIFRIPKPAAAVSASQKNPQQEIVLEAASIFAKGERSAARILPIEVYTNCDYIRISRNGKETGSYYPAFNDYPGVEHPPVIINELVGSRLDGSRFRPRDQKIIKAVISYVMLHGQEAMKPRHYLQIAWIMQRYRMKFRDLVDLFMEFFAGWGDGEDNFEITGFYNGREVVRRRYGAGSLKVLAIEADDQTLDAVTPAGTWDSTRIVFKLLDQYGNIMPFASEALQIEISGPAQLLGPSLTAFTGGVCAAWIKTTGEKGSVRLKASCSRHESETIVIAVN